MYKRLGSTFFAGIAAAAVGLGFWGYAAAGSNYLAGAGGQPVHPLTALEAARCLIASLGLVSFIHLFQLGRDPWQLVAAQFAVPAAALLWIAHLLLSGLRKDVRTAAARGMSGHTVVCGLGKVGMGAVQNLRDARKRAVAIALRDDSPNAASCEHLGVPVLKGDAKFRQVLLAAGIQRARTAMVATGSDSENMEIALQIRAIRTGRSQLMQDRIQVLAEMSSGWMEKHLLARGTELASPEVDFRFFSPCSNAARILMGRLRVSPAPEFEATTFVLAGFGAYGREIALQLIRCSPVRPDRRLKIIVFDRNADKAREKFATTDPAAMASASLEFVEAALAPGSEDWNLVERTLAAAGPLLGVALALDHDDANLCAALVMRSLLDATGSFHIPVHVRLDRYRHLGELVSGSQSTASFGERIQIFGTLEETLSRKVLFGSELDCLAQVLHAEYRRRPHAQIRPQIDADWEVLPEHARFALRWRADRAPLLLEAAGLHLVRGVRSPAGLPAGDAEAETLARLEHRSATIERRLMEESSGAASAEVENWNSLSYEQRDGFRKEAARLPQVIAGFGIETLPVRTVRLYDEWVEAATEQLAPILQAPQLLHCNMIVDLDDPEAVRQAARAFDLPSLSIWLLSRETPHEFQQPAEELAPGPRTALIQRAEGWAPRERVVLQTRVKTARLEAVVPTAAIEPAKTEVHEVAVPDEPAGSAGALVAATVVEQATPGIAQDLAAGKAEPEVHAPAVEEVESDVPDPTPVSEVTHSETAVEEVRADAVDQPAAIALKTAVEAPALEATRTDDIRQPVSGPVGAESTAREPSPVTDGVAESEARSTQAAVEEIKAETPQVATASEAETAVAIPAGEEVAAEIPEGAAVESPSVESAPVAPAHQKTKAETADQPAASEAVAAEPAAKDAKSDTPEPNAASEAAPAEIPKVEAAVLTAAELAAIEAASAEASMAALFAEQAKVEGAEQAEAELVKA